MTRIPNNRPPKLSQAAQPPLSYLGAVPDSDRAKKPALTDPPATDQKVNPGDRGPAELKGHRHLGGETVKAAEDIFRKENVRFYGGGIPNVFLDGGIATDAALERLLNWSSVL
jgi:hypothetical protein